MSKFEIVTDSTCDLPMDELLGRGVEVVPLYVTVDGKTYRDQVDLSSSEFYDKMSAAAELPKSSQPSPQDFIAAFRRLEDKGARDILSIHISSKLSGTIQSAGIAAGEVDSNVVTFDTKNVSIAHGLMVLEAMSMRDAGETLEATVEHLREIRPYVRLLAVPDTLENLVKNGRLSQAAGAATSLLDIKIQLTTDDEGNLVAAHKAKGTKRAFRYCVRDIEQHRPEGDAITLIASDARNRAGSKQLLDMIVADGYRLDLKGTYDSGPVISTHGGIGFCAIGYMPTKLCYGEGPAEPDDAKE